jgi:hypothetical protein
LAVTRELLPFTVLRVGGIHVMLPGNNIDGQANVDELISHHDSALLPWHAVRSAALFVPASSFRKWYPKSLLDSCLVPASHLACLFGTLEPKGIAVNRIPAPRPREPLLNAMNRQYMSQSLVSI